MSENPGTTSAENAGRQDGRHALIPPAADWFPRRQLPFWGLVGMTGLALYFSYRLVEPFLTALLWAIAFAVLANPLHRWLRRKVRFRWLAAGVSVVVVVLVLVLPTVALAPKLTSEAASAANAVSAALKSGEWREKLAQVKGLSTFVDWVMSNVNLSEVTREAARLLTTGFSSVVKTSVAGVVQIIVSIFLLFYMFRDQEEALTSLRSLLPITANEADMLFRRFSDTIYAIIYGKGLTALTQGILGAIGFWALGLPEPWFWGLVMAVLSFLPIVGASVVWGPAALYFALTGELGRAVLLVIWGVVIIAPIESFLYPIMLGHRLKLHNTFVLIAVLGGLVAFGPVGLVVGPAILALTLGIQGVWRERVLASKNAASPARPENVG